MSQTFRVIRIDRDIFLGPAEAFWNRPHWARWPIGDLGIGTHSTWVDRSWLPLPCPCLDGFYQSAPVLFLLYTAEPCGWCPAEFVIIILRLWFSVDVAGAPPRAPRGGHLPYGRPYRAGQNHASPREINRKRESADRDREREREQHVMRFLQPRSRRPHIHRQENSLFATKQRDSSNPALTPSLARLRRDKFGDRGQTRKHSQSQNKCPTTLHPFAIQGCFDCSHFLY